MSEITKCNVCHMVNTRNCSMDRHGCPETEYCEDCYSVEQGFTYYDDWEYSPKSQYLVVDEDGKLWDEELECIVGNELPRV